MMYHPDEFDRESVASRISVFRDQIERRLSGEITEEQFSPMRLVNGVHLWDHAYMLCVPIPRGVLSSRQLRMLAHVARLYDRGYARFTARRSVEFQWPALSDVPSALADLASVGLYPTETGADFIRDSGGDQPADASHDDSGHAAATIPLDGARDLSDSQMEALADLAETYGFGEVRVGRGQDIVLPRVALADLEPLRDKLVANGLASDRPVDSAPSTEAQHAREIQAA
jgi:sulfite reductase beta subunit-like hemoprotein